MLDLLNIKKLAADAGFDLCGVAPCCHLSEGEARFRAWLARGGQSSLGYMERNAEKRFDPRLLVEGARTAVVCAVSYKNAASEGYPAGHRTKIASYACTADLSYDHPGHARAAVRGPARGVSRARRPGVHRHGAAGRKTAAAEAGLGWIGRQSLLVTRQFGTCVLLGELILTDEADATTHRSERSARHVPPVRRSLPHGGHRPGPDHRHRALHLVRHHREGPGERRRPRHWIFGCDCCQSCCPWNLRAPRHRNAAFDPVFDPLVMDAAAWLGMDETAFEALCGRTPLTRSGLARIRENVRRNIAPEEPSER